MDERINTFLTWGRRYRRWADSTCGGYRRRVSSWLAWCQETGVRDTRATSRDVQAWLDTLHPSAGTHTHAHTALLAWFDWKLDTTSLRRNPVREVERVPTKRSVPRWLDAATVRIILAAAKAHGTKWHLYFGFMFYMGLRRAEACAVRWADIEGADGWLRVVGKGGQERRLPIHPKLRALIVAHRSAEPHPTWVFPGRYGDAPMSVACATQWTRRILDEAGLPHVTGHQARHAYGRRLLDLGHDVTAVMEALRHESLSSTLVYVRSQDEQVRAAVGALDW